MTLTLNVSRGVEETRLAGASTSVTSAASLGINYEVLENLLFNWSGSYTNADFGEIDRQDDTISTQFALAYLINEFFSLTGSYRFANRASDAAGQDFTANTFLVSLKSQY